MSKFLLVVLTLFGVGRPDITAASKDPKLPAESPSTVEASLDVAGHSPTIEYSGIKILKTYEEFREFALQSRLSIIYFKPEVDLTPTQRNFERQFLETAKNASEYLRWGFDVRVGRIDCANVKERKKLHDRVCDPKIVEANVARIYRGKGELIDLEINTLFDEDSLFANLLTILLINDIPIVENPDEIMELQDKMLGKSNIVFSYHEKIGSGTHRNIMEIAYNYKSKFQFVITSYNNSLAYLHLPTVNLARLPEVKVFVLLCAEAEYAPCPLISFPDSKHTITQYDFRTYLDNILRDPILEYPALRAPAETDPLTPAVPETIELSTFKSAFAEEAIHELRIIFDSRAPKGEEAKKFLKDSARGMSLEYRGLVGFVLIDRAFQTPPSPDTSIPALSSVTVKILPLNRDESQLAPVGETFRFNSAFSFDGPSLQAFKTVLDKVVNPPDNTFGEKREEEMDKNKLEVESLEDETVRSVESYLQAQPSVGGASWKNLVFDHVPQPKKDKKEFLSLLRNAGGKPKMVLFYLKTDGAGMAAALAFGSAARKLNQREETKDSLLRIQCMDWPDICERYGVFIYPTVKVFTGLKNGGEKSEEDFATRDWRGLIDVNIVVAMATLLQNDAVLKAGEATTELLADDRFEKAQLMRLTARLDGMKVLFEEVARLHHGEAGFISGEIENGDITDHCRFPSSSGEFILIFRPWDRLQPRICLDLALTHVSSAADMWAVISAAALRSPLPELTVKTFPQVIRDRKPLLILFVDEPQVSTPASKALANRDDAVGGSNVAARFAEALIDGRDGGSANAAAVTTSSTDEARAIGSLEALQGVSVAWMNVADHPVHKAIYKAYHPMGMNQSLPAISYVDLRLGKVVNVPLEIAMKGGSSWISGAAAKAIDYRTVSSPSVPTEDLVAMKVLQLEDGYVGPNKEHFDFKSIMQKEKEEKMNRTKRTEEALNDLDDQDDENEEEEIDFRGINKKSTKISGKNGEAKEMPEKMNDGDDEDEPSLGEMNEEEFADEVVETEKFWKRDPEFLKNIAPNMESEEEKKSYNRLLKGLIERNPEQRDELEGLAFTLEMPKSRHEEL